MPFDAEPDIRTTQRDVLIRAREYLERHGLCKHAPYADDGSACAGGAFIKCGAIVGWNNLPLYARLLGFNDVEDWAAAGALAIWNDTSTTTLETVLARFDAAIERLS